MEEQEYRYKVEYYAGTYEGTRIVYATDGEAAIAKVKNEIRRSMTLPMYTDGYKIVERED